jgi:hypothetical protein
MGAGVGPMGQGLENVIIRIDAANSTSYSGTGNTLFSLVNKDSLTFKGVTFLSNQGESYFIFGGAGVVTSGKNTGVSGTQSKSMSAWVRFGRKATQGLMSTGANGAGTGMALETSSTVWTLGRGNTGTATTVTYNAHQWYFATYVSEQTSGSTHNIKLYINGGLAHTAVVTSINLTNNTFRIGCNNSGIGISGQLARVNFYNKALSQKEIQKSYWNYKKRFGL